MSDTHKHKAAQAARTGRIPEDKESKDILAKVAVVTDSVVARRPDGSDGYDLAAVNRYGNNRKMWAHEKKHKRKIQRLQEKRKFEKEASSTNSEL